jgi:hypothetical protein
MSAPTNSQLPVPVSVTQGSITVVSGASEPAKERAIYNHSAFMAAMQSALANSSTYATFQTAMAALPSTP